MPDAAPAPPSPLHDTPRSAAQWHRWCKQLEESIGQWLDSLHLAGSPGRVRLCREGSFFEPAASVGLGWSALALKISHQLSLWHRYDPAFVEAWAAHLRAFQVPRSRYFEDRAVLRVADRKAGFWWFKRAYDVRRAESRQAAAALLSVGGAPAMPIPVLPPGARTAEEYLQRLPWDRYPWTAGSHASHLAFFLKLNRDCFGEVRAYEDVLPLVLRFLEHIRDERSGSWHTADVSKAQKVNAAMKVLTINRLLNLPVTMPEKLIDLCLHAFDSRDACHSTDALFVLHEAARFTSHRQREVHQFAGRMLAAISRHARADGGLSFYPERAQDSYYGVRVSEGRPVSDVHGTHLLTWAVLLCANLLGFGDDLGWNLPVT